MKRLVALLCLVAALTARADEADNPLIFTGSCDASAAAALDADLLVAASDEDNILRFYRVSQPGKPVWTYNLNRFLTGRNKSPEADIEGAARLGSRVFWITSHGRDAEGEPSLARCRLFALDFTLRGADITVAPAGRVYTNLLADLEREPSLAPFRLGEAARLPAKERGGLNIEALAANPDGGLLIGFRSPIPEGRALLVPLLNPNEVIAGQGPRFGDPIRLDLRGLGLRDMGATRRGYHLIAGPGSGKSVSRLYFWPGGNAAPQAVRGAVFSDLNPEAICFQDLAERDDLFVLSDDSNRRVNGKECSDLPAAQRQFRAFRVSR